MFSSDAEYSKSDTSTTSHSKQYIMPSISNTRLREIDLERLSNEQYLIEIYNPSMMHEPPVPKPRKSIKENTGESCHSKNNSFRSYKEDTSIQQKNLHLSENEESSSDEYKKQIDQNQTDKKKSFRYSQNRSKTISPQKTNVLLKNTLKCSTISLESHKNEDTKSKRNYLIILVIFVIILLLPNMYKTQPQSINNHHYGSLFKFIEGIKAKFHNQDSDSWNDISSAINEVISATPKVPSIILLFANETNTMNCFATELAHISSTLLHTDHPKNLNPEDFGDNAGDIINTLKEHFPPVKVIVIRDILNINAKAMKALHFLCDRVNPLIKEAIYILTMQTNNYQPSKKRLTFVEEHIRRKLSKSINQDILMPLITRITDGAIILVQSEPNLEHCMT